MKKSEGRIGMKVYFSRFEDEKRLCEITGIGQGKFNLKQLEDYDGMVCKAGDLLSVPFHMCEPVEQAESRGKREMSEGERMVWAAAYALEFSKRNTAMGAGEAAHDLKVAAKRATIKAWEAVDGMRMETERTASDVFQQEPTYSALRTMCEDD